MPTAEEADFDRRVLETALYEARHAPSLRTRFQARLYLRWRVAGRVSPLFRAELSRYCLRPFVWYDS